MSEQLSTKKQSRFSFGVADIALMGVMAASLEAVKLALATLPNIELVTLLLALYGYVFGLRGIVSTVVFVAGEILIWGFGSWVISYLIYWPLVVVIFFLIRNKVSNRFILAGIAVTMTVFFGVLTSLVDIGLFSGYWGRFWDRFVIYYMRGVPFYVAHVVCNAVTFVVLFKPLEALFKRLKKQFRF